MTWKPVWPVTEYEYSRWVLFGEPEWFQLFPADLVYKKLKFVRGEWYY